MKMIKKMVWHYMDFLEDMPVLCGIVTTFGLFLLVSVVMLIILTKGIALLVALPSVLCFILYFHIDEIKEWAEHDDI